MVLISPCITPQQFNLIVDFCPNNPGPYLAKDFLFTHNHPRYIVTSDVAPRALQQ